MVENRCSQISLLGTALLLITASVSVVSGQPARTGVYLSLKGADYDNNSAIPITEIGETSADSKFNTGLQCITDRIPCCATIPNRLGDWLFPSGNIVPGPPQNPTSFYRTRGDDGTVNLNRLNANIFMPTGLFCCVVPDSLNNMQKLCATITAGITVQITGNVATPALGQSYSLTCEIIGASGPVSAYQWRRNDIVLSESGSSLSFSSLSLSDAGQYTCQISVDGMMFSRSKDIRLAIPSMASVSVTSTPSSPVFITSSVTVTCTVELNSGILESDLSLLMVSAQLTHPNGTMLSLSNTMRGTTFTYITRFNSFGKRDSGNYTCIANIRPVQPASFVTGAGSGNGTAKITAAAMIADEELPSESLCTCARDVGIAVGGLILVEGIIAAVAAIIVTLICWLVMRRRKSGKSASDFAVSANMAYGQVKLEASGDVGEEYDNPDGLASGGNYEPTGCPAPHELSASKSEAPV